MQTGFGLKPDEKVGVFRMLTLVPAAMKLRKNPDKATLQESAPARRIRALAGAKEALPRSRLGCGENAALPGGRKTARCGDQGIAARLWRVLGRRLGAREKEEDSRYEPLPRIHLQDG